MVLAVPAFRVKLYVPLAIPLLRLRQKLFGKGFVRSYVKARMLTHDPEQAERYHADPLIFRQIAVNILLDLHDTSTRILADAGAITTPMLLLGAGSDWVVTLRTFDQPFNLVPSLHITFRTILADTYARHTRGALRLLMHVWFSLVGFSTVLTYQHQIVDVAGGFILSL